jgi:energy-coupling factor transporter ATP-binding protein EcfA2
MREKPPRRFVARPPEWSDVVRGQDKEVKFLERTQTLALRETLLREVIEPIERGTDRRVHALFVIGAPGSGKTTIVRRVAGMLIEEGRVIVADAGVNHDDPRVAAEEYIRALDELADVGIPVLLLLDDPLYAESGWFELLHKLSRPGFQGGVLAATPHFLYERWSRFLKGIVCHRFDLRAPTEEERTGLARLYGRTGHPSSQPVDDFLVLAMEAAAGTSFDDIIDRMWFTLNDGRPIDASHLSQLPWPVRALLIVSFFHREDVPCPEPLLKSALDLSGGVGPWVDVINALGQMRHELGWSIFRRSEHDRRNWQYQGVLWTSNHVRIAQRAWLRRPLAWSDVADVVIGASTREPSTVRYISELASLVIGRSGDPERDFPDRLVDAWERGAREGSVETRQLYDLATVLQRSGARRLADRLAAGLRTRATGSRDGWLAALQLRFLSSADPQQRQFPRDLDLSALISAADFSIAPSRAVEFGRALAGNAVATRALHERLLRGLAGDLPWELDASLLAWLLGSAPMEAISVRMPHILRWFADHPDDTGARPQFLDFLVKLPGDFDQARRSVIVDTMQWLSAERHAHDRTVRVKFLDFISHPICMFYDLRLAMAKQTQEWLRKHPADGHVRAKYLDYLLTVSKQLESQRGARLGPTRGAASGTLEDVAVTEAGVRLRDEFRALRQDADMQVAAWLRLESHQRDALVRVKYLSFLADPLCPFDQPCDIAVRETEQWLTEHEDDEHVRGQWLTFLATTGHASLRSALSATLAWLERHESPIVFGALLSAVLSVPDANFISRALEAAGDFVDRRGWARSDQVVVSSMIRPYRYVRSALSRGLGTVEADELLLPIRRSIETWCQRNPGTVVKPEFGS